MLTNVIVFVLYMAGQPPHIQYAETWEECEYMRDKTVEFWSGKDVPFQVGCIDGVEFTPAEGEAL